MHSLSGSCGDIHLRYFKKTLNELNFIELVHACVLLEKNGLDQMKSIPGEIVRQQTKHKLE